MSGSKKKDVSFVGGKNYQENKAKAIENRKPETLPKVDVTHFRDEIFNLKAKVEFLETTVENREYKLKLLQTELDLELAKSWWTRFVELFLGR